MDSIVEPPAGMAHARSWAARRPAPANTRAAPKVSSTIQGAQPARANAAASAVPGAIASDRAAAELGVLDAQEQQSLRSLRIGRADESAGRERQVMPSAARVTPRSGRFPRRRSNQESWLTARLEPRTVMDANALRVVGEHKLRETSLGIGL